MSTTPYARLLVSLNGGAAAAGGIEAAASDDLDYVYESTIGWPSSPAPYLEIYEAPVGWAPVPSTGWIATDGGGWKYYGTTPPPTIAAPDAAHFGKVAAQLVVGGGLRDGVLSSDMTSGATVLVRSASVGLESVAWRESTEFDSIRAWIGAVQRDIRLLETSLAAAGALTEAQLRAVSATLTAALPVNGKKITGLADGTVSTDAAAFGQIAAALASYVATSRTVTAGAGLTGGGDLSADRTLDVAAADASITVNANSIEASGAFVAKDISTTGSITAGSAGFIGVALDTSGAATLTLGGTNATALTVSRTGIVTTVAGGLTVNGSATTDVIRAQKNGIGSTETVALWIENLTNSGTQQSPQAVWSAFNGGTQVNLGLQWEPQSTSRGKWVFVTGTGSTAPTGGSGTTYWDSQDATFGEGWISNGFYSGTTFTGGSGFRFRHTSNNGGLKYRASDDAIYLTSYNTKSVDIETGADSGGSGGVVRLHIDGSGQGYVTFVPRAVSSSAAAVTFPLATCQNIRHTTTENTTVSFSGASPGMRGTLDFIQGGTGRTITMPTNGSGIEYDAAILALTVTGIVDATANTRTVLQYYVTDSPSTRIYVYSRSTSTIP